MAWGNCGWRSPSQGKGCCCVRIRSQPFFANPSPFRQPHLALFVPKCSCFGVLVQSHLLTSCPDFKSPLGMATLFLKRIIHLSFSIGDVLHYPAWRKASSCWFSYFPDSSKSSTVDAGPGSLSSFPFICSACPPILLFKISQPCCLMASDRVSDPAA